MVLIILHPIKAKQSIEAIFWLASLAHKTLPCSTNQTATELKFFYRHSYFCSTYIHNHSSWNPSLPPLARVLWTSSVLVIPPELLLHRQVLVRPQWHVLERKTVVCRAGRPSVLSEYDRRQIIRKVTTGEANTAVKAQRQLDAITGTHFLAQTVRNVLHRTGMAARVKPKKPLLTVKHRRQRLAFAYKYQHWTIDDWKRVIWSDECHYYWKTPDKQLQ